MSQTATLRQMDADILAALLDVGVADDALHKAAGIGAGTACQVLVDRAAQFYDDNSGVAGLRMTVTLFQSQIPAPARLDTITIGAEVFTLDRQVARDESKWTWVVIDG